MTGCSRLRPLACRACVRRAGIEPAMPKPVLYRHRGHQVSSDAWGEAGDRTPLAGSQPATLPELPHHGCNVRWTGLEPALRPWQGRVQPGTLPPRSLRRESNPRTHPYQGCARPPAHRRRASQRRESNPLPPSYEDGAPPQVPLWRSWMSVSIRPPALTRGRTTAGRSSRCARRGTRTPAHLLVREPLCR